MLSTDQYDVDTPAGEWTAGEEVKCGDGKMNKEMGLEPFERLRQGTALPQRGTGKRKARVRVHATFQTALIPSLCTVYGWPKIESKSC